MSTTRDKGLTETTWETFLKELPANQFFKIKDTYIERKDTMRSYIELPSIELKCPTCDKKLGFDPLHRCLFDVHNINTIWKHEIINYTCRNCQTFSIDYSVKALKVGRDANVMKYGQFPEIRLELSPIVMKAIARDQRQLLFNGLDCEKKGFGIGAYSYYRRVVENLKDYLIDKIIEVSKLKDADEAEIQELERAKNETQFSAAIGIVKDHLPNSLYYKKDHNPLALLHSCLSIGIHNQSDEDCLEEAKIVRQVLNDLLERISDSLKSNHELDSAYSALMRKKSQAKKKSKSPPAPKPESE